MDPPLASPEEELPPDPSTIVCVPSLEHAESNSATLRPPCERKTKGERENFIESKVASPAGGGECFFVQAMILRSPDCIMTFTIRALAPSDKVPWSLLWQEYLTFYESQVPDEVTALTYQRMIFMKVKAPHRSMPGAVSRR
jgi:hypothetical protein